MATMTRRRLLVFSLIATLVGLGVGAWALWPQRTAITRENAAKIQKGMTLAEVEAILGGTARHELPPGSLVTTIGAVVPDAWWQSEDAVVWLNLDSDGRVAEVHCVDGPSDVDPLSILPRWLRR
jgi:hypothetical protein